MSVLVKKGMKKRGRPRRFDYICPTDPSHTITHSPKAICSECSKGSRKVYALRKCKSCGTVMEQKNNEHDESCKYVEKPQRVVRKPNDIYSNSKFGYVSIRKKEVPKLIIDYVALSQLFQPLFQTFVNQKTNVEMSGSHSEGNNETVLESPQAANNLEDEENKEFNVLDFFVAN